MAGTSASPAVVNTVQEWFAVGDVPPGVDLTGTPVLVTGGTGFLGAYVVPRLVGAGCRVTVVGSDAGWREPLRQLIRDGVVRLIPEGEWWRPAAARRLARRAAGTEHLVHLAYAPPAPGTGTPTARARHEAVVNEAGTLELLAALGDRLGHVVLGSTVGVYGHDPGGPVDECLRPTPDDAYGAAKLAVEDLLRVVAGEGGPAATVLRFTTLYGAGETVPRSVPAFVRAGLAGLPATIAGDGLERRDYLHVSDAAQVVVRAVARPPGVSGGTVFRLVNAGSGTVERTVALAHRVCRAVAAQVGAEPPGPQHVEGPSAADLVCRTDRVRQELGFRPLVTLEQGLAEEVAWFASHDEWWRSLRTGTAV
ncbi:NAD-dependent epimerase/dehydratase family protein [Geodermatophilus sp. SYSU D00742]